MRIRPALLIAALALVPAAAHAGRGELQVPPAGTFLLGGEQTAEMVVSGRNTGPTGIVILAKSSASADAAETVIATVAPGGQFHHTYAPGEIALFRNQSSATAAHLSVEFTGSPSSLSMRYTLTPKR